MAESEVEAVDQTNQLKARIETKCKALPHQEVSHQSGILGYIPGLGRLSAGGSAVGV